MLGLVALTIFGLLLACGGGGGITTSSVWSGTKQLGVADANTYGVSVASDADGNIYVAGFTGGGLDGNMLTGARDFILTKYDSSGIKQYTKQSGVAGVLTRANSVATDAGSNIYVAGFTSGGLDGNTLTGTADFFLTKYSSSGIKQYTKQLGVAGKATNTSSVATDTGGNVYVVGYTTGALDGNTLAGIYDFFLTKYSGSGIKQYTKQLGVAEGETRANSVATDTGGNIYVAGYTTGGLDGNTLIGTRDFFFTKYDSSGIKQYTKQFGVAGAYAGANSVATDTNGNVYVAGYIEGGLDGNMLTGKTDFFLIKYDSNGIKQYTKQLGVTGKVTIAYSVAADTGGNVYVAGHTTGGLDGNTLAGNYDFFLTKYSGSGIKQYTKQLGVAGADTFCNSVATDGGGNIFVAGYTNGGVDGNTLTGMSDFYVTKFNAVGTKQ